MENVPHHLQKIIQNSLLPLVTNELNRPQEINLQKMLPCMLKVSDLFKWYLYLIRFECLESDWETPYY